MQTSNAPDDQKPQGHEEDTVEPRHAAQEVLKPSSGEHQNKRDKADNTATRDLQREEPKTRDEQQEELDEALDDSFPASDPVAPAITPQPPVKPKP